MNSKSVTRTTQAFPSTGALQLGENDLQVDELAAHRRKRQPAQGGNEKNQHPPDLKTTNSQTRKQQFIATHFREDQEEEPDIMPSNLFAKKDPTKPQSSKKASQGHISHHKHMTSRITKNDEAPKPKLKSSASTRHKKRHGEKKTHQHVKSSQKKGKEDRFKERQNGRMSTTERKAAERIEEAPGWRYLRQVKDNRSSHSSQSSLAKNDSDACPGAVPVSGVRRNLSSAADNDGEDTVPEVYVENLVRAVLVEDQQTAAAPFVEAKPVRYSVWKLFVAVCSILLVVIVFIITGLAVGRNNRDDGDIHDQEKDMQESLPLEFQPLVIVSLQLDEAPHETSWQLTCDGKQVANRTEGSYVSTFQLDRQSYTLSEGSICKFSIQDAGGNGLCCNNGKGHYKVHVGSDLSDDDGSTIRAEGSTFSEEETASFAVTKPWREHGSGIAGEFVDSYVGFAVSLSADGLTMAVGAPGLVSFEVGNSAVGFVQVMRFQKESQEWKQLGRNIETTVQGDYNGFAVSLSADGSIIAVGAPFSEMIRGLVRVYQYDNNKNEWLQLGQDLIGPLLLGAFRLTVSLSSAGDLLAVGGPSDGGITETAGLAMLYRLEEDEWKQIGNNILGDEVGDHFAWSVSLSGNGDFLAVGASVPFVDRLGGYVRIVDIAKDRLSWSRKSDDLLYVHGTDDWFGFSVDLSYDGTTMAVGAPGHFNYLNSGEGEANSYVQVYERHDDKSWTKKGQEIRAEGPGDNFGIAVCLSWDSDRLLVGAPFNDKNGNNAGMAKNFLFDRNTSKWVSFGQSVYGAEAEGLTGWSVSLSKGGDYMAIGATRETVNDIFQSGRVRYYGYD